ncbi:MAG: DUF2256 domain-containing protein [Gammaproteobacteria bacterium]|nr:DUF2256 domain-containing protein [Gammaproteobacteria bacterium]
MKNEPSAKICPVCRLPCTWRKRWRNNWHSVKYRSRRCASARA